MSDKYVDPIFVIGDIHGCRHDMNIVLEKIYIFVLENNITNHKIVFAGDYVDRGPNVRGVIEQLMMLEKKYNNVICIKGNHDQMAAERMPGWYISYAEPTLQHYENNMMIPEHIEWLDNLPLGYVRNGVVVTHADINPYDTLDNIDEECALWSRVIDDKPHTVYKYTVHGHTVHRHPIIGENRAFIDTGCCFYGVLTALFIPNTKEPNSKDFVVIQNV